MTMVQLLSEDGRRRDHPDFPLDVTPDEMRGMYREMVLTRRFDAVSSGRSNVTL